MLPHQKGEGRLLDSCREEIIVRQIKVDGMRIELRANEGQPRARGRFDRQRRAGPAENCNVMGREMQARIGNNFQRQYPDWSGFRALIAEVMLSASQVFLR